MKPILYVQKSQTTKHLAFDFCYTAMLGALEMEHKVKTFTHFSEVPNKPNHILVGSVEQCQGWLKLNNYEIPQAIDINQFSEFLKRKNFISHTSEIEELLKSGPIFIKPANKIKATPTSPPPRPHTCWLACVCAGMHVSWLACVRACWLDCLCAQHIGSD